MSYLVQCYFQELSELSNGRADWPSQVQYKKTLIIEEAGWSSN